MLLRTMLPLLALLLSAQPLPPASDAREAQALRERLDNTATLPLSREVHPVQAPKAGWVIEMVSSAAAGPDGARYLFQRGPHADPIVVLDASGRVLRSWGRGLFTIPHSIRVDARGSIWAVDAGSSEVFQFTPQGKKLVQISVGGQPAGHRSPFRGTTDIAFGANGHLYISDGYANARILEYDRTGRRLREWGKPGEGPGEFHLPHGIAADADGVLYVADRENGRIQRFDLAGRYLGEWRHLGKTFSLTVAPGNGDLYLGTQPRNEPNGAPGWLVRVDRKTGRILGQTPSPGHHSVDVLPDGGLLTGQRPGLLLWFRLSRSAGAAHR